MSVNLRRLVPVTAVMALLFTACGSDEPSADTVDTVDDGGELRAPTPIEAAGTGNASGDGRASAAAEEMSADQMIAPAYIVTDYVVSPDLPPLPDNTTGYVFDAATTPTADQVAQLAAALGVAGEPKPIDDGSAVSWRVGPDDGTAPSVVLWDDAMLAWNYDVGWVGREMVACASAEPAIAEVDPATPSSDAPGAGDVATTSGGTEAGADPAPDEPVVVDPPEECVTPEPPENVPTGPEAEARTTDYLDALGVDPASVTFDTWADEWSATVTANAMFDGVVARSWGFTYGENGELQYAWGNAATPEPVGPYVLVDLDTAVARLKEGSYGFGFGGRGDIAVMSDTGTATNEAVTVETLPPITEPGVAPAVQDPISDDIPVDVPEGDVEPAPGSEPMPVEPDGGIGDGAVPRPEPMPVEPMPEPEEITVTLVDVEPDLWWIWDVHGSVWLVPAYRFIGDDGGWYTVPAVTDDFLVQTEQPTPEPEPMPEPAPATTAVPPTQPGDSVDPAAVDQYLGLPLDEFTKAVEAAGLGPVRVAEIDGEPQALTMDVRPGRVNVAVETRDGVQYVIGATVESDDGAIPAPTTTTPTTAPPTTTPPTTVADPGDPQAEIVPIISVTEGIAGYPACGNEPITYDGVTWYPIVHVGFNAMQPDLQARYDEIMAVEREASPFGAVDGFARVAPPGPGDDVGTLVVWADGVARWVSDSGTLDVWLVDDEITYDWVC